MSTICDVNERDAALKAAIQCGRDGMFLDAYELIKPFGPLADWTGTQRVEIAWIINELGAPRLGHWHVLKAFRETPDSIAVRNAYFSEVASYKGPLDALELLESNAEPIASDDPEDHVHWFWLHVSNFTILRDFSTAKQWLERMEACGHRPDTAKLMRSHWLMQQDQYDEALAAAEEALAIRKARGSIQTKAHLLTLLARDEEAFDFLRESDQQLQVASFAWQMAGIAFEMQDFATAKAMLARFEELSPLLERTFGQRFAMLRCELARRMGNDEEAIKFAKLSGGEYGHKIAERLADPERFDRVDRLLDVPFVRQHDVTCGPATLAALGRFWNVTAEHVEVADEICYNGTTQYAERHWADENGFRTREFTVTEEATAALIGRGVPFTLVTRGATSGHLQAVIGYDGRLGLINIRDPFHRVRGTAPADELIEQQAAYGPRGMAMVPLDRAELIDDLDLPDSQLWDQVYALDRALIHHQRSEAVELAAQLQESHPKHQLSLNSKRWLGVYDGDDMAVLDAVQSLRENYPEDDALQMSELGLLGTLGQNAQRVERLQELVDQPSPHPLFLLQLAETLTLDGRRRDEAYQLLREAIRRGPAYARSYLELGDLLWARHERDRALRIYRFAACLDDKDEFLSRRYFDAAVALGRGDEALAWLQERFDRFGRQSMYPAATLYAALYCLRRHEEGLAVLERALLLRPDDVELKLFAIRSFAGISSEYWDRADEMLADAKPLAPERLWAETAASFATLKGNLTESLQHLNDILPRSPLQMGLRERVAELISATKGEEDEIEFWRTAVDEFPHFKPLKERYAMAIRSRGLEETRPVLEDILQSDPDNAWAVRELGQHLLSAGRLDEAAAMIDRAAKLDHEVDFVVGMQAELALRHGNLDESRSLLHDLLSRDINEDYYVGRLLENCHGGDQLQQELAWVLDQLKQQTVTGDALNVYRAYAESMLPADELLASLEDALEQRPDLWPTHQCVIRQLTHMQRLDDAMQRAIAATGQFPLEPAAWYEQYRVASVSGDLSMQQTALDRCQMLSPGNSAVARSLSELASAQGNYEAAAEVMRAAIASQPLDGANQAFLADILAELKQEDDALKHFEQAVVLMPDYGYAWNRLDELAVHAKKPDYRFELAQRMVKTRPHEPAFFVECAIGHADKEELDQAMEMLDRAEAIDPYREGIHINRARFLINSGQYDAAMNALQPPGFPVLPPSLQTMRAQLLWDTGQLGPAQRLIQETAEQHPTHMAAWKRLENWSFTMNKRDTALHAIEKQMEISPNDPDVLDAAGHAFVDLEENNRAIAAFERTIAIAPTYSASRCRLFDLLVDEDRWDRAEEVITNMPRADQHPSVIARRMQLSIHRDDMQQADEDFEAVIAGVEESAWGLYHGVGMLLEKGQGEKVRTRIERELDRTDAWAGLVMFGRNSTSNSTNRSSLLMSP